MSSSNLAKYPSFIEAQKRQRVGMAPDLHEEDEAHRLISLLEACHRVLAHLDDRQDRIAQAIRVTCSEVEARLKELGVAR